MSESRSECSETLNIFETFLLVRMRKLLLSILRGKTFGLSLARHSHHRWMIRVPTRGHSALPGHLNIYFNVFVNIFFLSEKKNFHDWAPPLKDAENKQTLKWEINIQTLLTAFGKSHLQMSIKLMKVFNKYYSIFSNFHAKKTLKLSGIKKLVAKLKL